VTRLLAVLAAVGALLCGTIAAHAHAQSYGFLTLHVDGATADGRLDIAVRDLDRLEDLDRDGDSRITWGELRAREAELAPKLLERIAVGAAAEACRLTPAPFAIDDRGGETYLALPFRAVCAELGPSVSVRYDLLFALDAQHRGLVDVRRGDVTAAAVMTPASRTATLDLDGGSLWGTSADFVAHGIHHIWIGTDHILFVVTLLLSAVLVLRNGRWEPAGSLSAAALATAKVVTAFTVAHSVTLAAAAFDVVRLPSALVESVIALSIVVAAVNVIYPVVTERLWMAAFAFGLMHGFGFASVLGELGLPPGRTIAALLAFNLGVEIGQLAIVAAVLPVLFWLRRSPAYTRLALPVGSGVIALVAAIWFVERSTGWEFGLFG
jgi:hypothetical protein